MFGGVFLLGGVAGVGVGRAYTLHHLHSVMSGPPGEARAHFRLEAMRHELDLDDAQVQKIDTIMKNADPDRDQAIASCKPQLDDIRARTDAQIVDVLRPDQRPKYEAMKKKGPFSRP